MDPTLRNAAARFFDEFVVAFRTFNGPEIARRYVVPYLARHVDGSSDCFMSIDEVARYFHRIVQAYHSQGCRACRYTGLEIVPMGRHSALGTVTWELLREDDSVLSSWRESYNLCRVGNELKVFASVDHVG